MNNILTQCCNVNFSFSQPGKERVHASSGTSRVVVIHALLNRVITAIRKRRRWSEAHLWVFLIEFPHINFEATMAKWAKHILYINIIYYEM